MNAPAHPASSTSLLPQLLSLAWPAVLTRLGIMAMGVTDVIIVGRHSATELGYLGLGWTPTSIVLVAGIGLLAGTQVITSRLIGAGRFDETGAALRRGLAYGLWLGLGSALILGLLAPPVMRSIGLAPDLAEGAIHVMLVLALSLPAMLVADGILLWFEAQGRPLYGTAAMAAANVVNLALALWLVPGTSPFPVQGAVAAAWVTGAARLFLLAALFALLWRWPVAHAAGVFRRSRPDKPLAAEQRRIGYGSGLSYGIEVTAFAGMNIVAGWLGTVAVAAWTVVLNVGGVVFMLPLGLASATSVLVGRGVGARDAAAARRAFRVGALVTTAALAAVSLAVFAAPAAIARAYTGDEALVAVVVPALVLACLFFLFDGLQNVAAQSLRARGDIWWPTALHFVSYVVIMIPLGWWLSVQSGAHGGVNGIVVAVAAASLFSAAVLLARFHLIGNTLPPEGTATA